MNDTPKSDCPKFRAGDDVRWSAKPDDVYTLACDEDDRSQVWPAGWPCSPVPAAECELVKAATDEERLSMLRSAVEANERGRYWPGSLAYWSLSAAEPRPWQRKPVTYEWRYASQLSRLGDFRGWRIGTWRSWSHADGAHMLPVSRPVEPSEREESSR